MLFCFRSFLFSQSPAWQWANGMTGFGQYYGNSITVDALGNVYTTGYFGGTADFDWGPATYNLTTNGGPCVFISKTDSMGNFIWAKLFDWGAAYCYSIALDDSDNVYTTGNFSGTADFDPGAGTYNLTALGNHDVFISKLDSSGNFVWAKRIGGSSISSDAFSYSIAVDDSGNVYTTGNFMIEVDFDPGPGIHNLYCSAFSDMYILKLNRAGDFVWVNQLPDGDSGGGNSVVASSSGSIYASGFFSGTIDCDPGPGTYFLTSAGGGIEFFVAKFYSTGKINWAKKIGIGRDFSIALDDSENVYSTGFYSGIVDFDPGIDTFNLNHTNGADIFILKLDSAGDFDWAKAIGGPGPETGISIATDAFGNIYFTGAFQDTADFNPGANSFKLASKGLYDIFLCKYDRSGNFKWAKSAGGAANDVGNAVAVDPTGHAYITGYLYSTIILFDEDTIFRTCSPEVFVAKIGDYQAGQIQPIACDNYISPSGNYIWLSSGTYLDTVPATAGGDSLIIINLTILNSTNSFQNVTACDRYQSPSGHYTWTSPGTYTDTIINSSGCDSIITTHLFINTVDSSVTQNGITLTANLSGATYQWLDCNNGFAPLINDTNSAFTASSNGNYAVAIIENGCDDTSACFSIINVGIADDGFVTGLQLFPIPATSILTIAFNKTVKNCEIIITDLSGRIIYQSIAGRSQTIDINIEKLPAGMYFLKVKSADFIQTKNFIVERQQQY